MEVNQGKGELCYTLTVADLQTPAVAAHIHQAPADVNGPVVVNFAIASNGLSNCLAVNETLLKDIRKNPEQYYVNVHTPAFPAGEFRGQLGK